MSSELDKNNPLFVQVRYFNGNICEDLYLMQQKEILCDAVILAKGGSVRVHKLIMLTYSPLWLQQILTDKNMPKDLVQAIDLSRYDIEEAKILVKLMYLGNANVPREKISIMINLCEIFGMKKAIDCLQRYIKPSNQEQIVKKLSSTLTWVPDVPSTTQNRGSEKNFLISLDSCPVQRNTSAFCHKVNLSLPSDVKIESPEVLTESDKSDNGYTGMDENTDVQSTRTHSIIDNTSPISHDCFLTQRNTSTCNQRSLSPPSSVNIDPLRVMTETENTNNLFISMCENTAEERLDIDTMKNDSFEINKKNRKTENTCSGNESIAGNFEADERQFLEKLNNENHMSAKNNDAVIQSLAIKTEPLEGNEFKISSRYSGHEEIMSTDNINDEKEIEFSEESDETKESGSTCNVDIVVKKSKPFPCFMVKNRTTEKEKKGRNKRKRQATEDVNIYTEDNLSTKQTSEQSIPPAALQPSKQIAELQSGYIESVRSEPTAYLQTDGETMVTSDHRMDEFFRVSAAGESSSGIETCKTPSCAKCSFKTTYQSSLNRHTRLKQKDHLVDIGKKKPAICDQCGSSYKTKTGLTSHIKMKHKFEYRYRCEYCDRGFDNKSNFDGHIASHQSSLRKKCDICNAEYRYKKDLVHHLASTHGTQEYRCSTCDKIYKSKEALKEHQLVMHSGHTFPCRICNKAFRWRSSLQYHKRKCTANVSNTTK